MTALRRAGSVRQAVWLALVLLAGCAGPPAPAGGSRLVIAMTHEPASLNPLTMTGPATSALVPLIYSFLLTLDEHGNLRPDIATVVPSRANGGISADGLTIVYHLRHDAKWQDGAPLSARDVVFTFAAIMNPRNNVASRSGYDEVARVEASGAWTVRVHLRRVYAPILSTFLAPNQNYGLLPAHVLAKLPDLNAGAFNAMPVGSGPYRVAGWRRGEQLSLVRNAAFYGGRPGIEQIDVRFVADSNTILNQLRTQEVMMTLAADPALLAQYRTIAAERVIQTPVAGAGVLFFNLSDPVLRDVDVRRAIVAAVDFPRLVRQATRGAQTFAHAARGLVSWGYDPAEAPQRSDPRAAARLLDAAGWRRAADGFRRRAGRPLALQFAFESGNAVAGSVGVLLQQELAASGIALTLHAYSPVQLRAPAAQGGPLFGGRYQLGFLEIYTSADPDVGWLLGCDQFPPNGFNISRYCNPVTQQAIRDGAATYERARRYQLAGLVQRQIGRELPIVALWQQNSIDIVPAPLVNFRPSPVSPVWNAQSWRYAQMGR